MHGELLAHAATERDCSEGYRVGREPHLGADAPAAEARERYRHCGAVDQKLELLVKGWPAARWLVRERHAVRLPRREHDGRLSVPAVRGGDAQRGEVLEALLVHDASHRQFRLVHHANLARLLVPFAHVPKVHRVLLRLDQLEAHG